MNDNFRELKARFRELDALLGARGTSDVSFAQAVSALRRALKHGDRTRDPSPELRTLLDKAQRLGGIGARSSG